MKARGFTLLELIMVLVLTGILAAAVIPRFFDKSTFDSLGFSDTTLAALRYAQRQAIAQRRTVCVSFTTTTVTLNIAAAAGSSTCPNLLAGPAGENPFVVTARGSASFATIPADLKFNALGQASGTAFVQPTDVETIQVSGAATVITVEQETGYVHQ